MRRRLLVAFLIPLFVGCAKPAWEQPPPEAHDAPVVDESRLHRAELPNGLKIIVLEDPRLPRLSLGLATRRGAANESPAEAGLASMTAALMERGAGERDALALAQAVDEIGASFSVHSGWDSMGIGLSGLSRDIDVLFEILGDVALRPTFDTEEVRKVRSEKFAALKKAEDDPGTLARWNMSKVLYPEHRYGIPVQGSKATVPLIPESAMKDFYKKVFVPSNAVFYAVGDVRFEDILGRVDSVLGAWEDGETLAMVPAPPGLEAMQRSVVIVNRPDLVQAQILLGHAGIARDDPERIPIQLMVRVFGGGGFSSRLMRKVRSDEGLTYGVHAGFAKRRVSGQFFVSTFTRVNETGRMVNLLLEEMVRIQEEPVTSDELRNAKSYAVGRFALSLETAKAVMGSLVDLDLYGLPDDLLDTYRRRIRAVTTDDTARAAKEKLDPERISIVAVGPAEILKDQLSYFGPVQIVEP